MKTDLHPAYVLHSRPYRETSLLLEVLSRDHGRVRLVAKGAKQTRTNTALVLQPCQRLLLAWSGKSELMTLTRAEQDGPAPVLAQERLLAVFYLNELILRLLHQQEGHPALFDIYDQTLNGLAGADARTEILLRVFEKRLLQDLGYGLVLDHDAETGMKIDPLMSYCYLLERGPVRAVPAHGDYVQISGAALLALYREQLEEQGVLQECKSLMRHVLHRYLGHKPLASRNLYASYRNLHAKPAPIG